MPTTFEAWKNRGQKLIASLRSNEKVLRDTENALEGNQWEIGDWLIEGEVFGEGKAYLAAMELTGWTRETLHNVVWVVRKFPKNPESSSLRSERSKTKLRWSHFKELARITDKVKREEVFNDFNDGHTYTVYEVRDRVEAELRKAGKRKDPKGQKSFVSVQVSLNHGFRDEIKDLAKLAKKRPDVLLRELIEKYFEEYKTDLTKKIRRRKTATASKLRPAA